MDSGALEHKCLYCHYEWCRLMNPEGRDYCLDHEDDWDSPCPHWKPMTHGDYIRSLTDDELAEYMNNFKFQGVLLTKQDWKKLLESEYTDEQ